MRFRGRITADLRLPDGSWVERSVKYDMPSEPSRREASRIMRGREAHEVGVSRFDIRARDVQVHPEEIA